MNKIIFFDFHKLKNYKNIELYFNKPKNEEKFMNLNKEERYITIIPYNNSFLLISKDKPPKTDKIWNSIDYYSGDNTYIYESNNSIIKFDKRTNLNIDPIVSHNIVPFFDKDNSLKLVGGLHYMATNYDNSINKKEKNVFIEHKGKMIVNPNKKLELKCNGIYLLNLETKNQKYNAEYVKELPIINGTHMGLIEKRTNWTVSNFDGRSIVVYFKGKYIIYVRSNVKEALGSVGFSNINKKTNIKGGGSRAVQYATSDDLFNWSDFKFINIDFDFNKDNIYYFAVQKFTEDILVSTFPYSNGKEGYIGISYSYDGINWTPKQKLVDSKVAKINTDRIIDFNIHHIIEYQKEMFFFIHKNYFWWDKNSDSDPYISRLKLKKDRLTNISSNTQEGYFEFELSNIKDLAINYKLNKDGYIIVQIDNKKDFIFNNFEILKYSNNQENNDSIYKVLKWKINDNIKSYSCKEKSLIQVKIMNSNIYCIYY